MKEKDIARVRLKENEKPAEKDIVSYKTDRYVERDPGRIRLKENDIVR